MHSLDQCFWPIEAVVCFGCGAAKNRRWHFRVSVEVGHLVCYCSQKAQCLKHGQVVLRSVNLFTFVPAVM